MSSDLSRRSLMSVAAGVGAVTMAGTLTLAGRTSMAQTKAAIGATTTVIRYTRQVGDAELITILDGHFLFQQDWFKGLTPAQIGDGLAASFLDPTAPLPLHVAVHLIRQGDNYTLIDAGAGAALGPTVGKLVAQLTATGVPPDRINRIFVTHLHPDHIGGMLAGEAPVFANATVHISAADVDFWTDEAAGSRAPDALKPWFAAARGVAKAYRGRIKTFQGGTDLGDGISAVPTPGHTVGHTAYRLSSGKSQILFWGDSTALAPFQFSHVDAGIVFDTDSALAATTRRRMLDMVVADRMLVAGTHMPFPGVGHVAKRDQTFAWVPDFWSVQ